MSTESKFSENLVQTVVRLCQEGVLYEKISEYTGLTKHQIGYILRKKGQKVPLEFKNITRRKYSAEQQAEVVRLRKLGLDRKVIAQQTGIPLNSIKKILKQNKVQVDREHYLANVQAGRKAQRGKAELNKFGMSRVDFLHKLAKERGGAYLRNVSEIDPDPVFLCARGHEFSLSLSSASTRNGWCGLCAGNHRTSKELSLAVQYPGIAKEWHPTKNLPLTPESIRPFSGKKIHFKCLMNPKHEWCSRLADRVREVSGGCPDCSKTNNRLEKKVGALLGLQKYNSSPFASVDWAKSKYRPDFKLNDSTYIDAHGLLYHSSWIKSADYHYKRKQAFDKLGVRLFEFWEDEINDKPLVVKSIVDNFLGKSKRIGARKLTLKIPTKTVANVFLDINHIIGKVHGSTFLGLFDGDDMLMCIAYKVDKVKREVNITRVATKIGHSVQGGLSRLIKPLLNLQLPLITFIDRRYADGHAWFKLGFTEAKLRPNYQYTDGYVRVNKAKFRVKAGLNEEEEARAKKFYRLYDSGKLRLRLEIGAPSTQVAKSMN